MIQQSSFKKESNS